MAVSFAPSYLKQLHRVYVNLRKNLHTLLEGCCSVVELIDEDDLTNWYVLLRYEDDNKSEFTVSLRILFTEELERMPLVFVITPRLFASFIHHGAICSLELMSQQWSVDVEGICMLLRSLHVTLNPFSHDTKVTVHELRGNDDLGEARQGQGTGQGSSISAYTREEHELGMRHIRHSHPYLFRKYAPKQARRKEPGIGAQAKKGDVPTTNVSTYANSNDEGVNSVPPLKRVVRSREELQQVFSSTSEQEVFIDVSQPNGASPVSTLGQCSSQNYERPIICALPLAPGSARDGEEQPRYCVSIAPLPGVSGHVPEPFVHHSEVSVSNCVPAEIGRSSHSHRALHCKATPSHQSGSIGRPSAAVSGGLVGAPHEALSVDAGGGCSDGRDRHYPFVLLLCGNTDTTDGTSANNRWDSWELSAGTCVVPEGCVLRLRHMSVRGVFCVSGTLDICDCKLVGQVTTERNGRVLISRSTVFVNAAEATRAGMLVLDASSLELSDGTVVRQDVRRADAEREGTFIFLQVFIHVSNSASLHVHSGCSITPSHCDKTVIAEQDAVVDVTDCNITSGYSSAVSILGCRAFFSNTRFTGRYSNQPQIEDQQRTTGLNVELNGAATARHCVAEHLYFGFSVIAHSVAHFYDCHANNVVNGYTIDASLVTIDKCSASTNHVGVFVLNKAKCNITNDTEAALSFQENCCLLLGSRARLRMRRKCRRLQQMQLRQQGDQDRGEVPTAPFVIAEHGHHDPACREENVSNSLEASAICSAAMLGDRGDEECASFEEQPHFVSTVASSDLKCVPELVPKLAEAEDPEAATEKVKSSVLPISFTGGMFGLEVRDASVVASGVVLNNAKDTSIYAYDEATLTLTDSIIWTSLNSPRQPCGVKVLNGTAKLSRCFVADYTFGFAAIHGTVIECEECFAVGGSNGFVVDNAQCTMRHCGADTENVGVLALSRSVLHMDNRGTPASANTLSCTLRGLVRGLESRSSDVSCLGVTVCGGCESGFTCRSGSRVFLEDCVVDMPTNTPTYDCTRQLPHTKDLCSLKAGPSAGSGSGGQEGLGTDVCSYGVVPQSTEQCLAGLTKARNSGVEVCSGSLCRAVGCTVRYTTCGYAATGPDAKIYATSCSAVYTVNGFLIDSAECELSHCSTESDRAGLFVLSHGTCLVRGGNYKARVYGIENKNGIVHVEDHVKLSGFSRIGIYVYDGGRFDTDVKSFLEVKVHEDPAAQRLPPQSATPFSMFPSCFAIDQGTAVIHSAELGGGARIAVNCGDRADVYLHLCTVEYCNVAFNALKGSQLWLSDCRTRHVWHRSLAVHRGAVSCVTSPSVAVGGDGGGSVLSAPLELAGRCYINNVVVCPRWESEVNRHSTTPVLYAAPFSTSTEQQESLIRVTGGGVLVMKACLVLLNEEAHTLFQRHRGSEVALSMVFAEGRDTSVLLNCVLFHISPTMLSGNGADPCVGGIRSKMFDAYQFLVLRNGARGEVRNITDRDVLDDSRGDVGPYLFHLSGADSRLCGAFHVMPLPCPRKVDGTSVTARAAVNFDGSAAVPKGARNDAVLKGAERDTTTLHSSRTVPVRILVQGTSTLKLENVQLRWLTVSGASTVTATLCHFAGANAVHVSDSSTLEAEQSVLVSAVGGPAVRVHNSMLTLKGCTGYRLYREVIAAQCSVLRLVGTTMHTAVRLDSEVSYDFGPKQPEKLTTSATLHNKGTASEEEVNETQGSVSGPHGGSVPDTGMVTRSTSPVVRDHTCMAFLQCIHSRSHTHHTEDAHSDITCHPHIRSMPRPFGSEERRTCLCNPPNGECPHKISKPLTDFCLRPSDDANSNAELALPRTLNRAASAGAGYNACVAHSTHCGTRLGMSQLVCGLEMHMGGAIIADTESCIDVVSFSPIQQVVRAAKGILARCSKLWTSTTRLFALQ